jgi:hypothetical protein
MNTTHTRTRLIAAALLSGVLGLAGFELAAGTAAAAPCSIYAGQPASCAPPEGPPGCYNSNICSQEWCPSMGPMRGMPNWDMNVCHTYYFAPGPTLPAVIIQGQPPGSLIPRQVVPEWLCPHTGC